MEKVVAFQNNVYLHSKWYIGELLKHSYLFQDLNPTQIKCVEALCVFEEYYAGSNIYKVGDIAKKIYVLHDGIIRFFFQFGKLQAPGVNIINQGEIFGWSALLEESQTRIATALCMSPSVVLSIDGNKILELLNHDRDIGYRVMKNVNILITNNLLAMVSS